MDPSDEVQAWNHYDFQKLHANTPPDVLYEASHAKKGPNTTGNSSTLILQAQP
jgi:hypothetical protein